MGGKKFSSSQKKGKEILINKNERDIRSE